MKNINSILSGLSRSGLLARTARGSSKGSLKRAAADTLIATVIGKNKTSSNQNSTRTDPLAAVGGLAWQAYNMYSQQTYGRNSSLQKANLQRAYMQGVYAQRNAQQQQKEVTQHTEQNTQEPAPAAQSRYIPSRQSGIGKNQTLTYSPATLSEQQFVQITQDEGQDTGQILILRAMIAAAYADGHIDENERQKIFSRVDDFELTTEDKASLFDELRNPLSLQQLVKAVPNTQTAIEVYAASLLAIDEHQPVSQDYLNKLGVALAIPTPLIHALHEQAKGTT
jgi:uncharacterized membrane protein YebE (DUF533 family)